ncbi:hypothetical protein VTJ04DRAFT_8274 [Mycothermus thermophilus]|uniref:uncharacterized protein n=1 Tax=Humicola insolens TaxID=85995 RepID=UPI00374432C5
MASTQRNRVNNAIDSLIAHLVPPVPGDDELTAQARHDESFELVRSILERHGNPAVSSDVNHAADLIKRKLIQTNPSQALRFANLYTRLLSLPVLNQKWAILSLLYQLSDSPDPNELPPPPSPPRPPPQRAAPPPAVEKDRRSRTQAGSAAHESSAEEDAVREAFSPAGLKKLPAERPPKRTQPEEPPPPPPPRATNDTTPKKAAPTRDVSIKSTLLAENSNDFEPSEMSLLRDLPYTLQGLSSATMPFPRDTALKLPSTLPPPLVSLLHTLAEPSLLYRGLSSFVKSPAKGLLGQSLRAAINNELRSYLTLVATLEAQIRRALSSIDESAPRGGIGKAGVTLKRCVVWTREATMGLRLMSLIAEESKSRHGGQLITLIHGFSTSHGDPVVAAFAERLLADVTRPFYDILRRWIYDGELLDPHLEFFVREQSPRADDHKDSKAKGHASVWNSKYEVVDAMVPSIMTADFAQKVFLIGKSLNFIRHSCGDSGWVDAYSKTSSKPLSYGDTATLEKWIDEAYKTTMRRLMYLMNHRFHVFDHLQALKNYILLGQGDFIALLMESLAANLDRPAFAQYRHTLTAQLEHAIRGSNAQYDSEEVLRRLDARMLQLSHGDIGWDCFTLEYKIDAPVDVVVTEWGNRQYLKVFNFLWRVKRVEFALSSTWRKCMTGARGVLQTHDEQVLQLWKSTRGILAEMVHFVGQLQYYILFEVIESSWTELQKAIRREDCTLDDLITAHTKYLTDITHKGLLGARRRQFHEQLKEAAADGTAPGTTTTAHVEDRNSYMVQLSELLHIMLAFRDSVDGLYSWSVADFTRRQEAEAAGLVSHQQHPYQHRNKKLKLSSSSSQQQKPFGGGTADLDDPFVSSSSNAADSSAANLKSELPALQDRLKQLGQAFKSRLQILLGDLAYQPDVDMRFLGVSMNFNDVYQPVKRKKHASAAAAAAAAAQQQQGQQQGQGQGQQPQGQQQGQPVVGGGSFSAR